MQRWIISTVSIFALALLVGCHGMGNCCSDCSSDSMTKCKDCKMEMSCSDMVSKCSACGMTMKCGDMTIKCTSCGKESRCREFTNGKCACGKSVKCPSSMKCTCGKGDMKCTGLCEACAAKKA